MRWDAEVVKELPGAPLRTPVRAGLRRHFRGYELGLVTLCMVATFALLALPRPSVPETLPLPRVDRAEASRAARAERELATRTAAEGLPFDVRAVGEAVRRLGHASATGEDLSHEQDDIRVRVKAVFDANQSALLLRLRAAQTEYFLAALRRFELEGKSNSELDELGGDFSSHAKQSGWLGGRGELLVDEATRRVLFHLRWADLIGKRAVFPFSLTLNEWRLYYRFLLAHPVLERANDEPPSASEDTTRLRIVTALGRKDPDYPTDMARGLLLHQLGDAEGSAVAYRRHLGTQRGGPYALLARNYLIYALQGSSSD